MGAGPGDPELLTLKAKRAIETCDTILYDYLVDSRILAWVRPDAERIYVGKSGLTGHTMSQEEIENLMVELCKAGKRVCRLKGGDPYIFGRGAEEGERLFDHQVEFEVVPGISSAIAAPAYAGIPVTHRNYASAVSIITGHEDPAKPESQLDWPVLAKMSGTLVFLMGVKQLPQITAQLIDHGKDPETPVAVVRWGTRPEQETVTGTLQTIAPIVQERQLQPPCIIVVGDVVKARPYLNWYETQPLFGKTFVITRARQQASELRNQLEWLGASVFEFPTIEIRPPHDVAAVQQHLQQLAQYQWVIFTSPNGVDYTMRYLFEVGLDVRRFSQCRIAAIGPATNDALKRYGLQADLLPKEYVAEAIFETLQAVQPDLAGLRFLLPRADIARDDLAVALLDAGAIVDQVAVYQTVCTPQGPDLEELVKLLSTAQVHGITFSSSSTVSNFVARLAQVLPENPELLDGIKLASIGPITSKTMRELLGRVDIEAPVHTIPGLVDSIVKHYQPLLAAQG